MTTHLTKLTLSEVLGIAAVSGRFDPLVLLDRVDDVIAKQATNILAEACDEDLTANAYRWVMKADRRRRTLREFRDRQHIGDVLEKAPSVDADDTFGQALRDILRDIAQGRKFIPPTTSTSLDVASKASVAAEATYAALHFVQDLPMLAAIRSEVEQAIVGNKDVIAIGQRPSTLESVLPWGQSLVGRRAQLRKIRGFVRGVRDSSAPILVTGIGGVGKSALLAEIVRKTWLGRKGLAIVLDFDRPTLAGAAPAEIMREFSRQFEVDGFHSLGIQSEQKPARTKMQELRRLVRSQLETIKPGSDGRGDTLTLSDIDPDKQLAELSALALPILQSLPDRVRLQSITLVLDSFETIAALGKEVVNRVLELESLMRQRGGLAGLRTIISGRSVDESLRPWEHQLGPRSDWVSLGGLSPAEGAALLASEAFMKDVLSEDERRQASKVLGGHPLALKVLTLYCRGRPPEDVKQLISELKDDPGLSAEFAQRFLYMRILDRIDDPILRKLAHPGLVLRQVSPDLIRLVLAEACDLGPVDLAKSADLFQRLVDQHWLVELTGPSMARHRPDLRRQMVGAMFAPPREADTDDQRERKRNLSARARAVSVSAARFFTTEPSATDPVHAWWTALGPAQREVEAWYHRALTEAPPSSLDKPTARRLFDALSEEIDLLPIGWRAIIKAAAGAERAMSDAEREMVGGVLRTDIARRMRLRLEKSGATSVANSLAIQEMARLGAKEQSRATKGADSAASFASESMNYDAFEARASLVASTFQLGDIRKAAELAAPLIESVFEGRFNIFKFFAEVKHEDFWRTGVWLGALAIAAIDLIDFNSLYYFYINQHHSLPVSTGFEYYYLLRSILSLSALSNNSHEYSFYVEDFIQPFFNRLRNTPDSRIQSMFVCNFVNDVGFRKLDKINIDQISPFSEFIMSQIQGSIFSHDNKPLLSFQDNEDLSYINYDLKSGVRLSGLHKFLQYFRYVFLNRDVRDNDIDLLLQILRGVTPELHKPTISIMLDIKSPAIAQRVVDRASTATFWPVELKLKIVESSNKRPSWSRSDIASIVEIADRCGVLLELLDEIAKYDSRANKLIAVHKIITARLFTIKP